MIEDYLNQKVTVYRPVGKTGHGDAVYDAGTVTRARVTGKNRLVQTITGELVQAEYVVWVAIPVKLKDKIAHGGRDWAVLSSSEKPDLDGNVEFWEVMI